MNRNAPTTSGAALTGIAPVPQDGTSSELISKLLGIKGSSTLAFGDGGGAAVTVIVSVFDTVPPVPVHDRVTD
jgi:hypothetical protein